MKFTIPTRIAEIVFAIAFAIFGVLHLKYTAGYKAGVPSFMPGDASLWVYITGICFIAAAIAIIINKYKKMACYLLALLLIVFVVTIHLTPAVKEGNYPQLLKDGALAMAAIIIGNTGSK